MRWIHSGISILIRVCRPPVSAFVLERILLVLIAIPVLIFKNALRIRTLSYLAVHFDPRILTSALHREGGIPFFVLGLLLLYPVLALLMKSESKIGG
jgi:exosortase/archaeosortase family protein